VTEAKAYRCDRCDVLFETTDAEKLIYLTRFLEDVAMDSYHLCFQCAKNFLKWLGTEQGKKDASNTGPD